jgi:hypothetical protein
MQKVDLYRYEENNGMVTITPNRRNETDTPRRMRLIADENCILTDGTTKTPAVDVMLGEVDKWQEIGSADEATEADYISALEDLGVKFGG